jgi:Flp pilus assembly protein TadG
MKFLHHQEGSNLVEFSLVILPLLAIVFLIIDSAWVIFAKSSLQWAAREGVRYAITSQTMPGLGQDASVKTVVQQSAFGFLAGNAGLNSISISYYDPATLAATSSNAGGNIVLVSVSGVPVAPLAPLWRDSTASLISVMSSDVMESSPGGIPPTR